MLSASSAPVRGEWTWASTVAEIGADRLFSRCAAAGVTDICLLVKGTGGKIAWQCTKYKDIRTRTDRDILAESIRAAHACGIRLHAWICNLEDAAYRTAHPEAGMHHYVRGQNNDRIRLRDAGYAAYMAELVTELAAYDIDGLHLDYIRLNHLSNGWSEEDFAALRAMGADLSRVRELIETTFGYGGRTPDGGYAFRAYAAGEETARLIAAYRRDSVVRYARHIIAAARAAKPELIISAALMPEGACDVPFADLHYGQNYTDAAALYDYICPMAYSGSFSKDAAWVAQIARSAAACGNHVVMGLQAFGNTTSERLSEEIAAVRALRGDAACGDTIAGTVLFRTGTFSYASDGTPVIGGSD